MNLSKSLGLSVAALVVSSPQSAAAQARTYPTNLGAELGATFGGPSTRTVGVEIRRRVRGPLAFTAGVGRWFLEGGCDAIVGAPCYENAWTATAGAAVGFGRVGGAWHPYLAARVGPLRYNTDTTVWTGTAGAGVIWKVGPRLGLEAEVRRHVQFRRGPVVAYAPPTSGRSVLSVGLVVGSTK